MADPAVNRPVSITKSATHPTAGDTAAKDADPAEDADPTEADAADRASLRAVLAALEAQLVPTFPIAQHDRTAGAGPTASGRAPRDLRGDSAASMSAETCAGGACFAALVKALRATAVALQSGGASPAADPDTGDADSAEVADAADLTA